MTFHIYEIIAILFAHWIGDFVLQSDWQAKNKSKNNVALGLHVTTYTLFLFIFSMFVLAESFSMRNIALWEAWAFVNGVLHFGVDYVTSRINTHLWSKGRVHDFFVSVGFDQFLHIATLMLTLGMLHNVLQNYG